MNNRYRIIIIITISVVALALCVIFIPQCRSVYNTITFRTQKADDTSNYETIKKVEDTCRSMIASYNADKLTYEQYKDSDNTTKLEWAEMAKMRANKTAASYNEYILKNSFVWKDNIPDDILKELPYIGD